MPLPVLDRANDDGEAFVDRINKSKSKQKTKASNARYKGIVDLQRKKVRQVENKVMVDSWMECNPLKNTMDPKQTRLNHAN